MIRLGRELPESLIAQARLQPADQGMPGFIQILGFTSRSCPEGASRDRKRFTSKTMEITGALRECCSNRRRTRFKK